MGANERSGRLGRIAVAAILGWVALPVCASSPAMNYLMHCQGCHHADGSGQHGYIPDFRGSVSRFLALPEGRAYLGRVPGTSQSLLNDAERAEVLNYVVSTFDPAHLPVDFVPYSADELARYRLNPVSQASVERAHLVERLAAASAGDSGFGGSRAPHPASASTASAGATSPPPAFAICGACHPTSNDGAHAMGPNLRGVVGRQSGSAKGFPYSAAMKAAGIKWTRDALDQYLKNVQAMVPGTMMTYPGVADDADRAAIIRFLESLN